MIQNGLKVAVLCCLFAFICASVETNSRPITYIVGGSNAPKKAYPWFALAPNGCGGFLVSPEFILTAAHCAEVVQYFHIGAICGGFSKPTGTNCGENYETAYQEQVFTHPEYTSGLVSHDFALVKLTRRSEITPVDMDLGSVSSSYTAGKELWAIGFGQLETDGDTPERLQHVKVSYVEQEACRQAYGGGLIDDTMLCAADNGKDACNGDSGGPLYDAQNGVVAGIVSFGGGCAHEQYPGVYSRISNEVDWISFTICDNHSEPRPSYCDGLTLSPTLSPTSFGCDDDISFHLKLTTDSNPNDNGWFLEDVVTRQMYYDFNFPPSSEQDTEYTMRLCLPCSQYKFTIYDTFGDGIKSPGGYELFVNEEKIATGGIAITEDGETTIFTVEKCGTISTPPPIEVECDEEISAVLEVTTDFFAYENSWEIQDQNTGEIIYSSQLEEPLVAASKNTIHFCLPCGNYIFSIYDSYSDGISSPGGYIFFVNGEEIAEGGADIDVSGESTAFSKNTCDTLSPTPAPGGCSGDENSMVLNLGTDRFGEETSWNLVDADEGIEIQTGSGYKSSSDNVIHMCVRCGTYTFTMYDSYGDGFVSDSAGYSLKVDGKEVASGGGNIGSQKSDTFKIDCSRSTSNSFMLVSEHEYEQEKKCLHYDTKFMIKVCDSSNQSQLWTIDLYGQLQSDGDGCIKVKKSGNLIMKECKDDYRGNFASSFIFNSFQGTLLVMNDNLRALTVNKDDQVKVKDKYLMPGRKQKWIIEHV